MTESGLRRGLTLFNSGHFFAAHEVLEDVWREAPRPSNLRRHLQGLVQLAVAFHHHSTGNCVGACSVLERALRNLEGAEDSFPQINFERLRTSLAPWREFLLAMTRAGSRVAGLPVDSNPPSLPKIVGRRVSR